MYNKKNTMKTRILPIAATLLVGWATTVEAAKLMGLGDLPGGPEFSQALGVSADGSVVAGKGNSTIEEGFFWSRSDGMEGIGELSGGVVASHAEGVSGDGQVLVGRSHSEIGPQAFRWTRSGGMQSLGSQTGHAYATSSDGSVVVGTLDDPVGQTSGNNEAFLWSVSGGMAGLGYLPGGGGHSDARAVSADGAVVVGFATSDINNGTLEAFRWTETTGMTSLGIAADVSYAKGISDDGLTVVGHAQTAMGVEAYRWTEATGVQWLGDLPGGLFDSLALDASADGSIIVGQGNSVLGPEAFVWDASLGMRNLSELLSNEYGVDLNGWKLHTATSISADGMTIVGNGYNPFGNNEAWLVDLTPDAVPEPTTLTIGSLLGIIGVGVMRHRQGVV